MGNLDAAKRHPRPVGRAKKTAGRQSPSPETSPRDVPLDCLVFLLETLDESFRPSLFHVAASPQLAQTFIDGYNAAGDDDYVAVVGTDVVRAIANDQYGELFKRLKGPAKVVFAEEGGY